MAFQRSPLLPSSVLMLLVAFSGEARAVTPCEDCWNSTCTQFRGSIPKCADKPTGTSEKKRSAKRCANIVECNSGCDEGDAAACLSVGSMFETGIGVEEDTEKAGKFFKRACQAGSKPGCQRWEPFRVAEQEEDLAREEARERELAEKAAEANRKKEAVEAPRRRHLQFNGTWNFLWNKSTTRRSYEFKGVNYKCEESRTVASVTFAVTQPEADAVQFDDNRSEVSKCDGPYGVSRNWITIQNGVSTRTPTSDLRCEHFYSAEFVDDWDALVVREKASCNKNITTITRSLFSIQPDGQLIRVGCCENADHGCSACPYSKAQFQEMVEVELRRIARGESLSARLK